MKIKKGDQVQILSGKDKGKNGKVLKALPNENKVIVEGVNMRKVHKKARNSGKKGEVIDRTMPISASNVAVVDPKTNKPTRVGKKLVGDKFVRVTKGSGTEL